MRICSSVALVAFATAMACSPSNSATNQTSLTEDQACTEFATNFCSRLSGCSTFQLVTTFESAGACQARMKPICLSVLQAPGTGFTPDKYDGCAKSYASASCDDLLVFGFRPAACQVKGTLANGAACGDSAQCSSGYCTMDFFQVCGVCADPVAAGGPCSKSAQCQDGLVCLSPGTCVVPAKLGESCSNATCDGNLNCVDGLCAQPLAAGASCDPTQLYCDTHLGLQCDSTTQRCVERPTAPIGANCTAGQTCRASGSCNSATGMCDSALADGAACNAGDSLVCQYPAQCIGGVCARPDPSTCH